VIVKTRDGEERAIEALEWRARTTSDKITRDACLSAAARLRADPTTESATEFIDEYFADTDDWAVIHDLRFRVGSRALQLNHVLISNAMDIICIDSRYLKYGLEFLDGDRCMAYTLHDSKPLSISSPLNKMSRDIRLISKHVNDSDTLPRKFGVGPRAALTGFVVTDPALRIRGEELSKRESVAVLASDALFPLLWKRESGWSLSRLERLRPQALYDTALRLIAYHEPTVAPALLARTQAA